MPETSTAKRLAKNTLYMYLRMGILMLISLYTSRIILQQLGVDDFGIYNLVGSVVAMFSSLRTLFASSTQRYINFEMGQGNEHRLVQVFNMSISINLIIGILFFIFAEVIGLWFIENKMVLDSSRIFAAKIVLHLSILTAVVSMISTSFDALVIAHERMDFYAYMAIAEGFLRLAIVFLLSLTDYDKLIVFALLIFALTSLVLIVNMFFCRVNFQECRFRKSWDKNLFKSMGLFAGWNFLGNTSYTLTQSGLNMVLNMFSGVAANAARGIAYQVNTALNQVLISISTVVNPVSTKFYASGQKEKMFFIMFFSSKIFCFVQVVIALPFAIFAFDILYLWLGQVPEYTVVFLQLVLLHSIIRSVHSPLDNLFKSVGILKHYQLTEIVIQPLSIILAFYLLQLGYQPYLLFVSVIVFEVINLIAIVFVASKDAFLPLCDYLHKVLYPCLICAILAISGFIMCSYMQLALVHKFILTFVLEIIVCLYAFFIGFTSEEKKQLLNIVKH